MHLRLRDMCGLGAASEAALLAAGVTSPDVLRTIGSVAAYVRLIESGHRHNLNMLWALEAAITDRHWQDVARTERVRLLMALDDLGHAPK